MRKISGHTQFLNLRKTTRDYCSSTFSFNLDNRMPLKCIVKYLDVVSFSNIAASIFSLPYPLLSSHTPGDSQCNYSPTGNRYPALLSRNKNAISKNILLL